MAKVMVIGFGPRESKVEKDGTFFRYACFSPVPEFEDYKLIVLPFTPKDASYDSKAGDLTCRRAHLALEKGADVCVLYGYMEPDEVAQFGDYLGGMLLRGVVRAITGQPGETSIVHFADELAPYIREYGSESYIFKLCKPDEAHVICKIKHYDLSYVSGFAIRKGEGLLYVVPGSPPPGNEHPCMRTLANGILAHSQRLKHPSAAPIVQSFQFAKEKPLLAEREELVRKTTETDEQIKAYDEKKDILFLRDDPLADRLAEWLTTYMEISTRRHEQYVEDFWLLDEQGNDMAICEAKGVNNNVKREHITALVLHREHHDLADDFPSILIMNTFADAETVKQKDRQGVGRLELHKATKGHVLIVRTLDLVRLLDLLEQGRIEQSQIRELLLTETGWLRVSDEGYEVVRD